MVVFFWLTSLCIIGSSFIHLIRTDSNVFLLIYAEYITRNAGLEETKAGIKIAGRNINNLKYADDTTLMAESEEELVKTLDESESRE